VEAIRSAQWLVVGLGNPGPSYAGTRHNVGFAVVDCLAAEAGTVFRSHGPAAETARAALAGTPVLLLKPQAFMNLSGGPVAACLEAASLSPERLLIVHDDLDLPLGRIRISARAGAGGHRGVASIQSALGVHDFPRVRVGIGRPAAEEDATDRVLAAFTAAERSVAARVIEGAAAAVRHIIRVGVAAAMNQFNGWMAPDTGAPA
jgi:PTH1 family peptidyl-tRNA hydrolase